MAATFYRRGKVWWIRTDPVTKQRRSTGCTTAKARDEWFRERERLAANPRDYAAHKATLKKWCDNVLTEKQRTRSEGTVHMYDVKLRHIVRLFGASSLMAELIPSRVDWYVGVRQAEGASNHTIHKELVALSQVARSAARAGEYAGDPKLLRPTSFSVDYEPVERVLSSAELALLSSVMPAERFAGVAFILATSARAAELRRAKASDYNAATKTMLLRGSKTKRALREVPILPWNEELMARALPYLPVPEDSIRSSLKYWLRKLERPHASPNDLRRTCATTLVANGVTFEIAARILGHAGIQMLYRVYAKLSGEQLGKLAIEQAIAAGSIPSQSADGDSEESDEKPSDSEGFRHKDSNLNSGIQRPASQAEKARKRGKNALSPSPRRTAVSVPSGTKPSQLTGQLRRLEALALLDPEQALPGLELVRGAIAAMRPGVRKGLVHGHLRRAAELLEMTP